MLDWDDNMDFEEMLKRIRAMSKEEIEACIEKYDKERLQEKKQSQQGVE